MGRATNSQVCTIYIHGCWLACPTQLDELSWTVCRSKAVSTSFFHRYRRSEKFTWHLDALAPDESEPQLGGQRTATLIVYLTDLSASNGGATMFRDLSGVEGMLKV
jgi:hypothetical protein